MKPAIVLSLLVLSVKASISVHLFLNLNQCTTCNMGLSALTRLAPSVNKQLFLPRSSQAVARELLDPFGPIDNLQLRFYDERHNPFLQSSNRSFCLLYDHGQKVDSFEINELLSRARSINALAQSFEPVKSIAFPAGLKFSERSQLRCHMPFLNVFDYTLGKNVLLRLDSRQSALSPAITLRGKDFPAAPFLASGAVDTAMYRAYYKYLAYLGKTHPDIAGAYVTDSMLYLSLNFPCAIQPPQADTGIGGKIFLYRKNLFSLKSELFAVPKTELQLNGVTYLVDNTAGFYVRNNSISLSLYRDKTAKTGNHVLAEFRIGARELNAPVINDLALPDSVYTNHFRDDFFNSAANSQYYYGISRPVMLDIESGRSYNLETELGKRYGPEMVIRDVTGRGGLLRILMASGQRLLCVVLDEKGHKVVNEIRVNAKVPDACDGIKFLDYNTLAFLDTKQQKLILLQAR